MLSVQLKIWKLLILHLNLKLLKALFQILGLTALLQQLLEHPEADIISFIESGKVFVNGKMVTSNGHQPKSNDIISVRGKGRFIFEGSLGGQRKAEI